MKRSTELSVEASSASTTKSGRRVCVAILPTTDDKLLDLFLQVITMLATSAFGVTLLTAKDRKLATLRRWDCSSKNRRRYSSIEAIIDFHLTSGDDNCCLSCGSSHNPPTWTRLRNATGTCD